MRVPVCSDRRGVYLVQPKFPPSYWGMEHFLPMTPYGAVFPPLGLLTLAALTPADFRVAICDENAGEEVDFGTDAQIVGVTGYIIQMRRALEIADRFRALGKTVVMGGPLANLLPYVCRPHCDVLFEGEAEYTWPRFLREFAEGRAADHYVEADKIHLPDSPPPRLGLLRSRYAQGIVQCTRGCPFTCEFCDIIVMYGRKMRFKPVEQVLREVRAWHARGITQVFFADDNFIGNRAYARELLRALVAWNARQRNAASFHTQLSIDVVRDQELLCLLREANFHSVFVGIESPRKQSLAETRKTQNEKLDLVEAVHTIQSHNLFVSAGMIVGFDNDDAAIFDEQYDFLQEAQVPFAMLSVLLAVPKTPLYERLKREGRLLDPPAGADLSHFVGTAGGTNFRPRNMTQDELRQGQERLYRRLYAPEAFAHRLLGNLSRFQDVGFRPDRVRPFRLAILARLARHYWGQGPEARRFFWGCMWQALRRSPRLLNQMATFLGMYVHFSRVHGQEIGWDPWRSPAISSASPSAEVEGQAASLVEPPDFHPDARPQVGVRSAVAVGPYVHGS